ncbi:MAG: bifunctional diguanylate cyclase/phosphodiesterase [Acidimicrobiia bacterium]|nr:bifunctional diguanylate cyclase/phosphodiesterase [Acidimicrobiia bacterium]
MAALVAGATNLGLALSLDRSPSTVTMAVAAAFLISIAVGWLEQNRRRYRAELTAREQSVDSLTGLATGASLMERLNKAILRADRDNGLVTVIALDLDEFGDLMSAHGEDVSEGVLISVSRRIRSVIRDSDTIGRIGDDEFVAVLEGGHRIDDAGPMADKVLNALAMPHDLGAISMRVTASAGVAIYPLDGDNAEELLERANLAVEAAKIGGRNGFEFYSEDLRDRNADRLDLMGGLRRALNNTDQLRLVYQPKIDLTTGDMIGVEALVRWDHPELGLVMPGRFIPLAEESDLIVLLGTWVLNAACAQARQWVDDGTGKIPVSVNVSSRQFRQENLVGIVREALAATELDPEFLEIELTEHTLIEDVEEAKATLHSLKDMGIRVSIDDFGTGYSSLSYLKRFPIDTLKIDQSFINDITHDADDAAISQAIVALARTLRMQVIAEGVETSEQLEFVRGLGCDAAQGYVYSRPVHPDRVDGLTGAWN